MPLSALFRGKSGESQESTDNSITRQHQTALALVDAFNRLDTTTIWRLCDRKCRREIYPQSLGVMHQDSKTFQLYLSMFANTFKETHMSLHEIIEDIPARKVCLWVIVTGHTISGPFTNEYAWSLEFDGSGNRIIHWKEFADSISTKAFLPELIAIGCNDVAYLEQQDSISTCSDNNSLCTCAGSTVSTVSCAPSNISSQLSLALSHEPCSQHSQQPSYQLQPRYASQPQPGPPSHPSPRPSTSRPNLRLPPSLTLRRVPTEIQGNGRTLGTLR